MPDPLIGITTYGQNEERHFPLPREYVDSVRRAGGLPMLIPPGESRIERILETVDGLILAGGGDKGVHIQQAGHLQHIGIRTVAVQDFSMF